VKTIRRGQHLVQSRSLLSATALIAVQDLKGNHDDTNARNMTPAVVVLCHYHGDLSSWGSSLHHSSSPVSTIMPFGEVRDQMSL
jgi:hypothetical protein